MRSHAAQCWRARPSISRGTRRAPPPLQKRGGMMRRNDNRAPRGYTPPHMARRVLLLGSTGSVGRQSLQVLAGVDASHRVVGLSAARSAALLSRQAHAFAAASVCLVEAGQRAELDLPAD